MDAVKAMSSFRLFQRIGRDINDAELYELCNGVLALCEEQQGGNNNSDDDDDAGDDAMMT